MAKPTLPTLNGIRSASVPSGRDVAEAFDALLQQFEALQATVAKITPKPVTQSAQPITNTTLPTNPNGNPSNSLGQPGGFGGGQPTNGAGSEPLLVVSVTGDYTASGLEYKIDVDSSGNCTISLTGAYMGQTVIVKNYSSNGVIVTINDSAGGTIDNESSMAMEWQNTSVTFVYDGTSNWEAT